MVSDMSQFGVAWLALCVALAIHVADEALTDFLSVYNPAVRAIRARFPFLPLPRWMRPIAYAFGIVMVGNGLLHLAGSVYLRKAMPGVYSAPLLLAAAVYLLVSVPVSR